VSVNTAGISISNKLIIAVWLGDYRLAHKHSLPCCIWPFNINGHTDDQIHLLKYIASDTCAMTFSFYLDGWTRCRVDQLQSLTHSYKFLLIRTYFTSYQIRMNSYLLLTPPLNLSFTWV